RLGRIGRVREDLQERRLVREIVHVEFQPPGVQRHAHGGVDYIVRRYIDVAVAAVETLRVRAVLVPVVGAYERWQAPADREVIADVQRPGVAWGAAQLVAFADQRRLRHVLEDRSVAGELVLRVSIAGGHVELRQPQTLHDQLELGAPRLQIRPVGGEGERAWLVAHDGLNLFPLHEVDRAVQQHTPIAPGRLESGLVVRERVRIEPDEAFRDVERRSYEGV